jgi:hypothetical protein
MSTESNEQYRAGFEAAARRITHVKDFLRASDGDGYRDYVLETYWQFWTASKRGASTEPSALVESLRAALRSVNAVAIERGDKYGACDQIDNAGGPYQSAWFAKLLADQAAGALTDDAKDAAPAEDELIYQSMCGEFGGYWQDNSDAKEEFERYGIGYRIVRIVAEVRAPDDDEEAHTKEQK